MDERIAMYVFTSRVSVYHLQFGYDIRRQFRNAKKTVAGLPDLNKLIADLIDEVKAQKDAKDERALMASRDSRRPKERKAGGTSNGEVKTSGDPNMTCSGCGGTGYEESKCWTCHPALKKAVSNWKASTKQKTQANIATRKNTWSEDELFLAKEQSNECASEDVIEKALLMSNSTDWILDSGASSHYCNDESQMRSYMPCKVDIKIGKGTVNTVGKGQASTTMVTSDSKHTRVGLTDVYFVPQMATCLITTERLRAKGLFYRNEDNILYKRIPDSDDISVLAQVYSHRGLP
jgi:hypothetical protein